jgi:flavorubredoxin
MPVTNEQTGTRIDEIAPNILRISTPVPLEAIPGGFTFNQFLLVDDEPLLFHTGPRKMFPLTHQAVASVIDPARLRWISFSHFEADECGALNEWLEAAPNASPLCSTVAAMVSVDDFADRPARALSDGETVSLGHLRVTWLDTPHLPHGMEAGYLFETTTRTLLCGDLFAQPGADTPVITESEALVWEPSEAMRQGFPYAPIQGAAALLNKLAATEPQVLACMHGASYRGDGAALLQRLGAALDSQAA